MPQLLVRNVSDETVRALRERAARHGRSVEAEHRAILDLLLKDDGQDWRSEAERLKEMTRLRSTVPSWVLIREDRDSR